MLWEVMHYAYISLALAVIIVVDKAIKIKEMRVYRDSLKAINSLFLVFTLIYGVREFHELISAWGWFQSAPVWRLLAAVLALLLGVVIWLIVFQVIHILPPYETEKEEAKKEED